MLQRCFLFSRLHLMALAVCAMAVIATTPSVRAGGIFRNGAVGGVSIDADGVLRQPTAEDRQALRQAVEKQLAAVPNDLDTGLALRSISLRQLEKAVQEAARSNQELPAEVRYLAGLQRVQYILVYPEHNDIVLVGPAEGWQLNEQGQVVGKTTGLPVLQLDDLAVALQIHYGEPTMISCSIDPTPEGMQSYRRYEKELKKSFNQMNSEVLDGMEQALGPQQVTVSGVPETSHFARVLVAADFRMKRIAMRLEESPLSELPSFLEMLSSTRVRLNNMMPRWWLACDYEPLAKSADGLAWELRGQGVRVMTEDSLVTENGTFEAQTGRENPVAAKWANQMTKSYDKLSKVDSVFGQLRNLMDMSVVAAIMRKEQLLEKASLELPTLTGSNHDLKLSSWNPPKSVATECSFIKRGRDYLITASGGVQIDSWKAADNSQVTETVAAVRAERPHHADRWWW